MLKVGLVLWTLVALVSLSIDELSLKCLISAGGDDDLRVAMENSSSSDPINVEVHVALILEPGQASGPESNRGYWAPVDLDTGLPYGANRARQLKLLPEQTVNREIGPSTLLWDRRVSAVWPNRKLGEVVPDGRYVLHLEIDGPAAGSKTKSNRLAVVVESGDVRMLTERR